MIAEGIETVEQLESLRRLAWDTAVKLSCDGVQGFLFSRPVPPTEATEIVARGRLAFPGGFIGIVDQSSTPSSRSRMT